MSEVNLTDYSIGILSQDFGFNFDWEDPGIPLWEFDTEIRMISSYAFSEALTGVNNIIINRSRSGEFSLFFDSALILSGFDNTTTTSEKFVISYYSGDSAFDNITVSTTIETTTPEITTTNATNFTSGIILL